MAALGIRAAAEPVATAEPGGLLTPPEAPASVGWWAGGAWPGRGTGTVVVVGHVDTERGDLGVFGRLSEVTEGTEVQVTSFGNGVVPYVVRSREVREADRLPAELFSTDGPPRLALVTCFPPYDREQRRYARTLIVWADPA